MATVTVGAARISVEEYLHSVYRPDLDYVDGELEDRNVGEYSHNSLQLALAVYFRAHRTDWKLRVVLEQRMRISATRYRIPEVSLFSRDLPIEQVFTHPPLVCIEVLSPDDRVKRFQARVKDYFAMGVKAVWILDPLEKTGLDCSSGNFTDWHPQTHFAVEGTPIRMDLAAVFAEVD